MTRNPVVPSLYAPDLAATLEYYTNTLGFTEVGNWIEDGTKIWAEVALGDCRLWLFSNALTGQDRPMMSGMIYLFVEDVDAVAAHLQGNVTFAWGPENQPYGLRELGIKDVNGYFLVFAKDV